MSADAEVPHFRTLPIPEAIAWLAEHGEPADPRTDIDTASLKRRFPRLAGVTTTDHQIAGPHGRSVALRSYRDPGASQTARGLVWVHGGAFLGGSLDMPESNWVALELASRGIPVLAVDYSKCLGTVHFPVPADEVAAAWAFGLENASKILGVAPERLTLGGASAGSTLVAGVTAGLVADRGLLPDGLLLVYPLLHPDGRGESPDVDLNSPHGQLALNFVGDPVHFSNPRAYAGVASPQGFPPTFIVVCENDGLRPSGERFAAQLTEAGVEVELRLEAGAEHGHIDHPGRADAVLTIEAIADWLRR